MGKKKAAGRPQATFNTTQKLDVIAHLYIEAGSAFHDGSYEVTDDDIKITLAPLDSAYKDAILTSDGWLAISKNGEDYLLATAVQVNGELVNIQDLYKAFNIQLPIDEDAFNEFIKDMRSEASEE